jgi:hypothetical protein
VNDNEKPDRQPWGDPVRAHTMLASQTLSIKSFAPIKLLVPALTMIGLSRKANRRHPIIYKDFKQWPIERIAKEMSCDGYSP